MASPPVTIVIPMAGEGSRFVKAGYTTPKPFIRINSTPMVGHVLKNLDWPSAQYILIARRAHWERDPEAVRGIEKMAAVQFHLLDELTEGTACTVLAARDLIPDNQPLLIANSDQLVRNGIGAMLRDAMGRGLDGSIMVFPEAGDPKWSYARCDDRGLVVEVAEKRAISQLATVGIYYFRTAGLFYKAAREMIDADDRVNSEFYTCPAYNYLIRDGGKVGVFEIGRDWMFGLGTPEDLERYKTVSATSNMWT